MNLPGNGRKKTRRPFVSPSCARNNLDKILAASGSVECIGRRSSLRSQKNPYEEHEKYLISRTALFAQFAACAKCQRAKRISSDRHIKGISSPRQASSAGFLLQARPAGDFGHGRYLCWLQHRLSQSRGRGPFPRSP